MEDKWQNAREQAQAQFESIKEMVEALKAGGENYAANNFKAYEDAQRAIHEDALSVEVRSDWHCLGTSNDDRPTEYRILLCTGGPAIQIQGELSEHGEPETARLMMQDWGLVWTEYRPHAGIGDEKGRPVLDPNAQEILLTYARQFYFGE
jgi:hypothetical protein